MLVLSYCLVLYQTNAGLVFVHCGIATFTKVKVLCTTSITATNIKSGCTYTTVCFYFSGHSYMLWCSQMFLNPHNWHLMRPISALPGHVLQLPHRRQPVSQSAARTLSSHCACDDGAKQQQRFHETLSGVINHVCFLILPVHTCEKPTASQASITQADKY